MNPVRERDLYRWSEWFSRSEGRSLKNDEISGGIRVSTVFIGIDFSGRAPPLLWETMIFGGRHDGYQQRYDSRSAALAGHVAAVKLVEGKS